MATLNEGIPKIEEGSTLETLYNRLLAGFKSSQDETLPDYTSSDYVIVTKDDDGNITYSADETKINASIAEYKDITMKNAAYLLASSIVGSSGSSESGGESGSSGGGNNLFVAITGDTMTGKLNAQYGFVTGANGVKIFEVYQTNEENAEDRISIARVTGELHLDAHGLWVNERNVLWYDNDVLRIDAGEDNSIELNGDVSCLGTLKVGDLEITEDGINFDGKDFYHSGNSNKEDVDWTMRDGTVAGNLVVKGTSALGGKLTALGGVDLGVNDTSVLLITEDKTVSLVGDLDIQYGGIKFEGDYIINLKNEKVVSFCAPNRIFNLGDGDTQQINLQADVYDDDGEYLMMSKFGDGYFPNSFKAGHFLGNVLIETYKNNTVDAGAVFSRYIRFGNSGGPGFYSDGIDVSFEGPFVYNTEADGETTAVTEYKTTTFGYAASTSLFTPLNKQSASLFFTTDADFYVFDKPLEGKKSIGIAESKTRICDNQLFFGDSVYWQGLDDGVKHYGNAYMVGSIGSVSFSSGFAGSGWKIYENQLTGNISATFDELTVRKKMRVYELEVQKMSVTNGSLWVSDACSGDYAEEIA